MNTQTNRDKNMKYKKEDNIEMWKYHDFIWYQETTYEAVVGSNPYLYDSDWDYYGDTEFVYEFVIDETQNMSMEKLNKFRQEVRELNKLLDSGELETLIENIKNNV